MTELYIFSQDDELLTILTESTGLIEAPFEDLQNKISDDPFSFIVEADTENAKHVIERNRVVFRDRQGDFREMVIDELDDADGADGALTTATCVPAWLYELRKNYVLDKRYSDKQAQVALNDALDGSRYVGEVGVSLGTASTNFYRMNSADAVWQILDVWGGEFKDVVELNSVGRISQRKILIKARRGGDNGLWLEIDHNIEEIERTLISDPITAVYGWGSSLETEGGGHTRYIDFGDVEWSKAKGDPVDKPKGQKWVGDPDALQKYGLLKDGELIHLYDEFSNQDYETPEELLQAAWDYLQKNKDPEINYKLSIDVLNKRAALGDTARAIDRKFARPIEIETRIIGEKYDLLNKDDVDIQMGQFLSLNEPLGTEIDDLRNELNDKTNKPIDNSRFPDIKPATPTNVKATGLFESVMVEWDYDSAIYISQYEVYASQVSGFVPDPSNLVWRGKTSMYTHKAETNQQWYFRVRALNTHGTAGDYSAEVYAQTVRIISDDILFGPDIAAELRELSKTAALLADGTVTWDQIEASAKSQIEQTAHQYTDQQIKTTKNDLLADIALKSDLTYVDGHLQDKADKANTYTKVEVNNALQGYVEVTTYHTDQDDIVDRLDSQSSLIDQNAQDILTKVEEQHFDDVTNSLSSDISAVDQKADSIQSTVSSIRIGGRNLLRNSDFSDGNDYWRNWHGSTSPIRELVDITDLSGFTKGFHVNVSGENQTGWAQNSAPVIKGEEYVLSVWVYITSGETWLFIGNGNIGYSSSPTYSETGKWIRMEYKFTSEDNTTNIYLGSSNGGNLDAVFTGVQLEKGNRMSAWSPNPADMDQRMTKAESSITQMADQIDLKVNVDDIVSSINLSKEGIRISGSLIELDGTTLIRDGVIGNAAIANASISRVKLQDAIIGTAQIEDAAITNAKIGKLAVDDANIADLSVTKLMAGTLSTDHIKIHGGSATDYTEIDGSLLVARGQFDQTWLGHTNNYDIKTMLQNGYLRFRNESEKSSLYFSWYGASTYVDGQGDDGDEINGSSGTIRWWDTTYSDVGHRGITIHSYAGTPALVSEGNNVIIHPYAIDTQRKFTFTKSRDRLDGYILFGDTDRTGLRFNRSSNGIVQVVDGNSATGGATEIEAGIGRFNVVRRRDVSTYVDIISDNYLRVGEDDKGRRIASRAIYNRTYSSQAQVCITDSNTLGRLTSASKYKVNIQRQYSGDTDQLAHSKNILKLHPTTWYDKVEFDESDGNVDGLKRYVGLTAENVKDVGLVEHVVYGKDNEIEGIEYDRMWVHLLPVINNHENDINLLKMENQLQRGLISKRDEKINQLEQRISTLEGVA